MSLSDASTIGRVIKELVVGQEAIKEDIVPDESDASIIISPFENIRLVDSAIMSKLHYPEDSFILDHPVYGELDSSTLKLDGGHSTLGYVNGTLAYYPLDKQPVSSVVLDEKEGGTSFNGLFKINLGAYYSFDGNAEDGSINGNDLSVSGATLTYDHLNSPYNAYSFNGTSDYLSSDPGIASSSALTIAGWFKDEGTSASGQPFGLRSEEFGFTILNGVISTVVARRASTGGSDITGRWGTGSYPIEQGVWYYVLMTQSSNFTENPRFYIAKKSDSSLTEVILTVSSQFSTAGYTDFYVGKLNPSANYFNGAVSETWIVDRETSEAEANLFFQASKTAKVNKPLVAVTDIEGESITGFRFLGLVDNGRKNFSYISDIGNPLGVITETDDFSLYIKFLPEHDIEGNTTVSLFGQAYGIAIDLYRDLTTEDGIYVRGGIRNGASFSAAVVKKIPTNTVCHATLTYSGSSDQLVRFYVNNVLAGTYDLSAETFSRDSVFGIGVTGILGGDGSGFNGIVDKAIVFNRVLSSDERTGLFNGTLPKESVTVTLR